MSQEITIIQDSREQTPLDFSGFRGVKTIRKGLKTGDYSLDGYESEICFERKSVADLVGTLIQGHERFLREMQRMDSFKAKYILIEHTPDVLHEYCKRHGWQYKFNTIIDSLMAYACHYSIRVKFRKNREDMARYIVEKAREFLKEKEHEEKIQTTQG